SRAGDVGGSWTLLSVGRRRECPPHRHPPFSREGGWRPRRCARAGTQRGREIRPRVESVARGGCVAVRAFLVERAFVARASRRHVTRRLTGALGLFLVGRLIRRVEIAADGGRLPRVTGSLA